jgi:Peptidase S80 family
MNSLHFACTSLVGTNKAGILKPNENGYYTMVVGALNMFNSAGEYYVYEQAKELFQNSSQLQRRAARGALRGEYGHPKLQPGQSMDSFARRAMSIHEDRVCCHHMRIWLDFNSMKDDQGKPVVAIMSEVAPNGPLGAVLQKQIENKNENVCFSIRAMTEDFFDRGINKRILRSVVTFDYVNEPGISIAEKFKSPALESFSDNIVIGRGNFERGILLPQSNQPTAMESSVILSAEELFSTMGWQTNAEVMSKFKSAAWSQW